MLDANFLSRDGGGKLRREYRSGRLHWSLAGYRTLTAALWSEVETCVR